MQIMLQLRSSVDEDVLVVQRCYDEACLESCDENCYGECYRPLCSMGQGVQGANYHSKSLERLVVYMDGYAALNWN